LDRSGSAIGITTKGRTAAELMVFARYVMFSEVYWHHAVRSATAMFQRLFFEVHDQLRLERIYSSTDATFAAELQRVAVTEPFWLELFLDLFGTSRQLYKRWGQFSSFSSPELFGLIARKPYGWLVACAEQLSWCLSQRLGQTTPATYVLIDAPPVGLEVQFEIDVKEQKTGQYFSLGELSPVVKSLAERQFDDYVKQVRVFVHPELRPQVEHLDLATLLHEAAGQVKWPIA
jgi:HD superfamily phosphohydrolase